MRFTDGHTTGELPAAITGGAARDDPAYRDLVINLAASIAANITSAPLVISFSGGQGSGKTTLARQVERTLLDRFDLTSASLSLDDFYLTRADRHRLAEEVHPLLSTRGVPGTHDWRWMTDVVNSLRQRLRTGVPVFNKATDDREPDHRFIEPADVILCEGWCWGARPEPANRLVNPVNELESESDADGRWRQYVNQQLAAYQSLFQTDGHVFLQVPSMAAVYRWRWQQEEELIRMRPGGGRTDRSPSEKSQVMDREAVRHFISYYERLTQWMLEDLPGRSAVCVTLDDDHRVSNALFS